MEKIGKLIICDCCHKEIFVEKLQSKDTVLDGGYTRIENFIDKPEGWCYSSDLKMDLCQSCSKQLKDAQQRMFDLAIDQSPYSIQVFNVSDLHL